jgi:hypothetical protein
MVEYVNQHPSENRVNIIERLFIDSDYQKINIVSNKRIVTLDEIERSFSSPDTFYIFESSTIQGFSGGIHVELDELYHDEHNVLLEGSRIIDCTPLVDDHIENLMSTDEKYILQKYGDNIILLNTNLTSLSVDGIEYLFGLYGFSALSDEELFLRKLISMSKAAQKFSIEDAGRKMTQAEEGMKQAHNNFKSHRKIQVSNYALIHGLSEFEKSQHDNFKTQIERLLRSSYLDTLEILDKKIVIITKPLYMGIWNIGQYRVVYHIDDHSPVITRIVPTIDGDILTLVTAGRQTISMDYSHPHIHHRHPCTGNFETQLEAFWQQDFLLGFNYAVQYIRSYSSGGGPYTSLANVFRMLGYVHDAQIISDMGVTLVDNGVIYVSRGGRAITEEVMREEWGCTGEASVEPDDYIDVMSSSERIQDGTEIDVEYHRLEE